MIKTAKKSIIHRFPFVKYQPTEIINFKTFCGGGSPEYVAAKKKLKDLFLSHQKESITKRRSIPAYSLIIGPFSALDLSFLIASCSVVLVAVLEKKLAEHEEVLIASIISMLLKIAFPLIAYGSILVLISKLGVFL